jgi:hypothetical protein
MYDLDDDLTKHYNQSEVAKKQRTAKFPQEVRGLTKALLKTVKKGESDKYGRFFEFKFAVVEAQDELLVAGAEYQIQFYPGAAKIDIEGFWNRVTPLLMSIKGETVAARFNAGEALGELVKLCQDGVDALDLRFDIVSSSTPAKPKKGTTELGPDQKNADGSPKQYRRDDFRIAA